MWKAFHVMMSSVLATFLNLMRTCLFAPWFSKKLVLSADNDHMMRSEHQPMITWKRPRTSSTQVTPVPDDSHYKSQKSKSGVFPQQEIDISIHWKSNKLRWLICESWWVLCTKLLFLLRPQWGDKVVIDDTNLCCTKYKSVQTWAKPNWFSLAALASTFAWVNGRAWSD